MYKQERNQKKIIAENLKKLMADKQWSQNELGRKLGLPAMTVNKWVNAVSRPRDEYLDKLIIV